MKKITDDDIERAARVNLPQFLMSHGFELKRCGNEYAWKEHDSLKIHDNAVGERGRWFRFSQNKGGDNIGFLREYMGMSFAEAVAALNGESYERSKTPFIHTPSTTRNQVKSTRDISLVETDNCKRVFAYLSKTRGLDYNMIASLVKKGVIAQEQKTGNVLFKYFDKSGKTVGAEKVGTSTEHKFKGIATGSAAGYGFEVVKGAGTKAYFFESAIDMLSYLQLHNKELTDCRLVSMMGVKPQTVIDTMERHGIAPENVFLCSDNDKAGNDFAQRLQEKYPDMKRITTPDDYKDWNDMLMEHERQSKTKGVMKMAASNDLIYYGNETWHKAIDNRDKFTVTMKADGFFRIQGMLEKSGINYYAYEKDDVVRMAFSNKADFVQLKRIMGDFQAERPRAHYSPQNERGRIIIGNTNYWDIPDKRYLNANSDVVLKAAELLEQRGVLFSGLIQKDKGTLTVNPEDFFAAREAIQDVISMRKQFAQEMKYVEQARAMAEELEREYQAEKMLSEPEEESNLIIDASEDMEYILENAKRFVPPVPEQSVQTEVQKQEKRAEPSTEVAAEAEKQNANENEQEHKEDVEERPEPAVAPEAEKPEIPTVKNLNQLKKNLKPGMMFEITDHLRPECIGERRIVTGVSTVDFTSRKLDENGAPTGKDIHMEFDRAKNWTFDGGELTSRLDNGDMLMSFHFIDSLEREQTVQAEKEPEGAPSVDKNDNVTAETPIDFSQYDDVLKNMFSVNPGFFKGMLSDETIEQQEQIIKDAVGEISHEDRMGIFQELMKEDNTTHTPIDTDKGENFTITDDNLGDGGAKHKFQNNIAAIKTLKTLEAEKQNAKENEQEHKEKKAERSSEENAQPAEDVPSVTKERTQEKSAPSVADAKLDVSQLIDTVKERTDFWSYGLRRDDYEYSIGDITHNSHQLYQDPQYDEDGELLYPEGTGLYEDFYDAGELPGTCALNADYDDYYSRILRNIETYSGKYLYVLGTDGFVEGGEDEDEIIMENATVLCKIDLEKNRVVDIIESTIHFRSLRNGIEAYDVSRDDYPAVAHISKAGVINIYDDTISQQNMERINAQAQKNREEFMDTWDIDDVNFVEFEIHANEDVIDELREHLEMNGYDVVWGNNNESFIADNEQVAYIEAILTDRNIGYFLTAKKEQPETVKSKPVKTDNTEEREEQKHEQTKEIAEHRAADDEGRDSGRAVSQSSVQTGEEAKVNDEPVSGEKPANFTITDESLGEGGAKHKFQNNIAAIKTLKTLEAEQRAATEAEKETLSKYVGWGGLAQAFDEHNSSWEKEYAALKELLTPLEYRRASASVLDSFYTSPAIIDGIYKALENFGFQGGNVLEPAMGVGNFFGRMPEEMQKNSQLYGVEIDSISGRIAQALYPNADIAIQGFEKNSYQNGCFDVAVGNVPFGDTGFKDTKHNITRLHDYFFVEAMDNVSVNYG